MSVQKIMAQQCQCCDEWINPEDDVEYQHGLAELEAAWQCNNCGAIYPDKGDAKECCS